MRRFFAILIIVSVALAGCSSKPSIDKYESNTIVNAEEDNEEGSNEVVLDGVFSTFDVDEISRLSGYKCKAVNHMPEEVLLKLLAEDSDVDIYFLPVDTVNKIKNMGLYYPIESQIVKDFNNSCFDRMQDIAANDNGDTVGMIVDSSIRALIYPAELEAETGVDIQGLTTLEEVLDFLQGYEGERVGYISDDLCFYYELLYQYEKYFCDFKNNTFDYNTDLYKNIYTSTVLKWDENGTIDSFYGLVPIGYTGFSKTDFDVDKLFMADTNFVDVLDKAPEFVSKLRAIPLPKINDDCKNCASATYAVINPNSQNIKGAVKVLETIAENRDEVGFYYGRYPMIYKDISSYSNGYMTDTEVFKDYYNIAANGAISEYWFGTYQYRYDIDDYRAGKTTQDEAIAEYRRMIDIWLNE